MRITTYTPQVKTVEEEIEIMLTLSKELEKAGSSVEDISEWFRRRDSVNYNRYDHKQLLLLSDAIHTESRKIAEQIKRLEESD